VEKAALIAVCLGHYKSEITLKRYLQVT